MTNEDEAASRSASSYLRRAAPRTIGRVTAMPRPAAGALRTGPSLPAPGALRTGPSLPAPLRGVALASTIVVIACGRADRRAPLELQDGSGPPLGIAAFVP